jgi:hypothetical protein
MLSRLISIYDSQGLEEVEKQFNLLTDEEKKSLSNEINPSLENIQTHIKNILDKYQAVNISEWDTDVYVKRIDK